MSEAETGASINPTLNREMARIRAAIAPSTGGDKEDLISYAKEVVRLRAARSHPEGATDMNATDEINREMLGALRSIVASFDEARTYAKGGIMAEMTMDPKAMRERGLAAIDACRDAIAKASHPLLTQQ